MAEIDKFVLEYEVQTGNSVSRLAQLDKSVSKIKEGSEKSGESFKSFASEATSEISKLVPGIDKVSAAVRGMGASFSIATAALAALAVGVDSVVRVRDKFNSQRREGNDTGVAPIFIEDTARKLQAAKGGGNVSREQSDALIRRAAEINTDLKTDPTGSTARNLRLKGMNSSIGDDRETTLGRLQEIQDRFRKMSDSAVISESKSFGIDSDVAIALKNAKDISKITNHSTDEIKSRLDTQQSLDKLNDQVSQLDSTFDHLRQNIGEALTPAVTKLVGFINDHVKVSTPGGKVEQTTSDIVSNPRLGYAGQRALAARNKRVEEAKLKTDAENDRETKSLLAKQQAAEDKNIQAQADLQQRAAEDAQKARDDNQAIIKQFAASVTTFANAIDPNQAIAAWAGAAGAASKLPAPGPVPRTGNTGTLDVSSDPAAPATDTSKRRDLRSFANKANAGKLTDLSRYDSIIESAAKKNDIPVPLAKAIIHIESKGRTDAVSSAGNMGLMQISSDIAKKYGVTDPTDPTQNINAGISEFAWFKKNYAHGDVRQALKLYNGGLDSSKYGPQNAAYPGKVLAASAGYEAQAADAHTRENNASERIDPAAARYTPQGYNRDSVMRSRILSQYAQGLGVPVTQVATGAVNKGDLARERDILNAGMRNQLAQTLNESHNPALTQSQAAQMMMQAADQARGIDALHKFSSEIIEKGRDGGRAITLGATPPGSSLDQLAVNININGAGDPHAVAKEIEKVLNKHIDDIHNGAVAGAIK